VELGERQVKNRSLASLLILTLLCFHLLIQGCRYSRNNNSEQAVSVIAVNPVSKEEKSIIFQRLYSNLAVRPFESIDLGGRSSQEECLRFRQKLPPHFKQGTLLVPEDWEHPESHSIPIFYYYRSHDIHEASTSRPPLLILDSVPGGSSHSVFQYLEHIEAIRKFHTVVYFDPRGTGCSLGGQNSPNPSPTKEPFYHSSSIIKDADAIRKHVFGAHSKWKIIGQGFGGYLVHRYLQMFPESIESAHSFGASLMPNSAEWIAFRLQAAHRAEKEYFSIYPNDRQDIQRTKSLLSQNHCYEDGVYRICGPAILDAFHLLLGFKDSWDSLHHWISALSPIGNQIPPGVLQDFVRTYVFGVFPRRQISSWFVDEFDSGLGALDTDSCSQAFSQLEILGEKPLDWTFNECRFNLSLKNTWGSQISEGLQRSRHSMDPLSLEDLGTVLHKHPLLRFYLYSSREDIFVPPETFAQEVQALQASTTNGVFGLNLIGRVTYRELPLKNHDGFYLEPQTWKDLN
jgi:pimeloyl-ACP methyl ester carboxylesterase